jgi:predicted ATPase
VADYVAGGETSLTHGQKTISGFRTAHIRNGLMYLALAAVFLKEGHLSRGELGSLLLPDNVTQEQYDSRLDSAVSGIRKLFRREDSKEQDVLIRNRDAQWLKLDITHIALDVLEFKEAHRQATLAEDFSTRYDRLRRAVELYGGKLGGKYDFDLSRHDLNARFRAERDSLEEDCFFDLCALADICLTVGQFDEARKFAKDATNIFPYDERGWVCRIRIERNDNRQGAERRRQDAFAELREQLGDAPPDIETLLGDIQDRERPGGIISVGTNRLTSELQHGHKTIGDGAGKSSVSCSGYSGKFFGRDTEQTDLLALLTPSSEQRLITLTGSGGSGKTRLACEIANRVRDTYCGAVWHVSLIDAPEPNEIVPAIRHVLALRPVPGMSEFEQIAVTLSIKPTLLILDNFEQLLNAPERSAESQRIVQALLDKSHNLKFLVTSRERIGIGGERVYNVLPMELPKPTLSMADTAANACVQLFVDRAQNSNRGFTLREDNKRDIVEICRELDGLPLALEIVAAHADVSSLQEMLGGVLTLKNLAGSDARHCSLQAAMDWSYRLLSVSAKRLFIRLAVFAGGWTQEAVAYVCGEEGNSAEKICEELNSLVRKSLVIREEVAGQSAYRLLRTVRAYAHEYLEKAGEETACRERHASYYLSLAERAAPHLQGRQQAEWKARLETAHNNMRFAFQWFLESKHGTEKALRLGTALWWFWLVRGYISEGQSFLEQAIFKEGAELRARAWADACVGLANLLIERNDFNGAAMHLRASKLAYEGHHCPKELAIWNNTMGNMLFERARSDDAKELDEARPFYEEALRINQRIGEQAWQAINLNKLCLIADRQGDDQAALDLNGKALTLRREIGDERGIASSLIALIRIMVRHKNDDSARILCEEAQQMLQKTGHTRGVASLLEALAIASSQRGKHDSAMNLIWTAKALRDKINAPLPTYHARELELIEDAACQALEKNFSRSTDEQADTMQLEQLTDYAHMLISSHFKNLIRSLQ